MRDILDMACAKCGTRNRDMLLWNQWIQAWVCRSCWSTLPTGNRDSVTEYYAEEYDNPLHTPNRSYQPNPLPNPPMRSRPRFQGRRVA